MRVAGQVLIAVGLAACGTPSGPPRPRPLPKVDVVPPLRGTTAARSPRLASYQLDARLDVARHALDGHEVLTWRNPGDVPLTSLQFHLYLNAFKNEDTLFMRTSRGEMRGAHASDVGWGWIDVPSIVVDGVELRGRSTYLGPDETVLEVPLPQPLAPGATLRVTMAFTAQLPEVFARTGYEGEFHMVGQWFPKIGVRVGRGEHARWACEPLHANSEFFADFGTYDVTLQTPRSYVVAATGVLTAVSDDGSGTNRTWVFRAEDVHDFAWMADPYMKMVHGTATTASGAVEVRVYYRPEHADFALRHLRAGIGAIEQFSKRFIEYPWPIMSIIDPPLDAAAGAGGMEYPTLVTTEGDSVFAREGLLVPEMVTVHEVGHNWFQGILASDEAAEAWLDEGVNEWADAGAMSAIYGPRTSAVDWLGFTAEAFAARRALGDSASTLPSPVATAAAAFVDTDAYGNASYDRTMMALRTLELQVGADRFAAAMKLYATRWAFAHPGERDLVVALQDSLGQNLAWFLDPVLHRVATVELSLRSATCSERHPSRGVFGDGDARKTITRTAAPELGAYRCEVVIENTGGVPVPVDIDVRFEDGTGQSLRWDDHGDQAWQRWELDRSSPISEVDIDPLDQILLGDPVHRHVRLVGDPRASRRAAARVATWGQLLMQVVGL